MSALLTVVINICNTIPIKDHVVLGSMYIQSPRADIEGQKMALFSYIANNHKRLNITWDGIASVLGDMLNKGNLALDIRRKITKKKRRRKSS